MGNWGCNPTCSLGGSFGGRHDVTTCPLNLIHKSPKARNLQCEGDRVPSSFCEVACAGQRQSTAVVQQTSSPYWAEMLDMEIRALDLIT